MFAIFDLARVVAHDRAAQRQAEADAERVRSRLRVRHGDGTPSTIRPLGIRFRDHS
jgi:hypothetical protein